MLPLEVQDTVSELIHLYSTWSPHPAEAEMWSRMLARVELTVTGHCPDCRRLMRAAGAAAQRTVNQTNRPVSGSLAMKTTCRFDELLCHASRVCVSGYGFGSFLGCGNQRLRWPQKVSLSNIYFTCLTYTGDDKIRTYGKGKWNLDE